MRADPSVVQPHEGLTMELGYTRLRVVLGGEDTAGAFAVTEQPLEAGALAGPLHTHANEEGFLFVLSGRLGAQVGTQTVEVGERGTILIPRGIKHTFWNPTSAEAVALELFAPAGLERWFEELARLAAASPPDLDAIIASARNHGTELDLDSLPSLLERHGLHLPGL
jgi:mannose-6-phosphate isomerase-like protein (cupin superfamily)